MNRLHATITDIQVDGSLSLVKLETPAGTLSTIMIDTPETCEYLEAERAVQLIFKETEVIIGTSPDCPLSLQNKIKGTVLSLEHGVLLSKITLNTAAAQIVAVIPTSALDQLKLEVGAEAYAMVKMNEIMLSE